MYPHRVPDIAQRIFPFILWRKQTAARNLYLSFDDGPIPEITPWVLTQLQKYQAKATFFCVGENIERNPAIFRSILDQGHAVGNHTYQHLNGWKTTLNDYIANTERCDSVLRDMKVPVLPKLFRPPYGKLTLNQTKLIRQLGFQIVLWDVMTGDFDASLDAQKCLEKTKKLVRPGSIIVFHDNQKAKKNLYHVLPEFLAYFSDQGYQFKPIQ
jgi:peptidoglycan-N-acetylglucosamine deacetylase